ncbi:hypothetical protein [Alicyclobacillus dauci]|uniref:Uncharacterized protein n=1 Tax=Alicyclobacillus dauci TaxID=1475485 RepID=A0ABY6Z8Z4_9BACL|nr:hypothetical protein [Alicyclobacillus dauci]WAH39345.1 hypothetical protein NZD86_23550 [Alicyclobacillus dauci]
MAAGVRPLLLPLLTGRVDSPVVPVLEQLSIDAWNRYNRFSLAAALVFFATEVLRVATGLSTTYWQLGLIAPVVAAFIGKLVIDKRLKTRLQELGDEAVTSEQQQAGHRRVELLSMFILILSVVLLVLPV